MDEEKSLGIPFKKHCIVLEKVGIPPLKINLFQGGISQKMYSFIWPIASFAHFAYM